MLFSSLKSKAGNIGAAMFGGAGYMYYKNQMTQPCFAEYQKRYYFEMGSTLNPKFDKRWKKGEDMCVVSPKFLGVLDGVGGWIEQMIDSGVMTKEYIRHIAQIVDDNGMANDLQKNPNELELTEIIDQAMSRQKAKGSTTATLAFLKHDDDKLIMKTLNIGDSGYLLLRPESTKEGDPLVLKKVFRSESQQHYFNCPFQIGNHSKQPSKQAFSTSHEVQPYDFVVLGTDGVWDNLFDEDVISMLEKKLSSVESEVNDLGKHDLQQCSQMLSTFAEVKSYDTKYESPFYVEGKKDPEAKEELGGKQDDITVIVAQIKPRYGTGFYHSEWCPGVEQKKIEAEIKKK